MARIFLRKELSWVGNPAAHYIRFVIYLFAFWMMITLSVEPKYLIMGVLGSLIVARVCLPLLMVPNYHHTKYYFLLEVSLLKFFAYMIWLMKELVLANLDVITAVLKPELPVNPQLLRFRVHFDNPAPIALLANSITLTPGTITVKVDKNNEYIIHALTPGAAEGILSGSMARKVAHLYGLDDTVEFLPPPPPPGAHGVAEDL